MSRFLCIDPGTTWGWSVVSRGEILASGEEDLPPSVEPLGVRWLAFQLWLDGRLGMWEPDAVIYEIPFGRFVNVLKIQFGQCTLIEVACEIAGLEYMGVRPGEPKKFATGKANCNKAAMMAALHQRWEEFGLDAPPPDLGENECDATWIALYAASELAVKS